MNRQGETPRMAECLRMAKIPGTLLVDMSPDGSLKLAFRANVGGGEERPVNVKDLDAAEALFMTCGLTWQNAVALRTIVTRNKVASMDTFMDEDVAMKFRHTTWPTFH